MNDLEKLEYMCKIQNELNCQINPDWINAGYPWYRAAYMEAAELIDHLNWKWWKGEKEINTNQVKLELIDIFHFALSEHLNRVFAEVKFGCSFLDLQEGFLMDFEQGLLFERRESTLLDRVEYFLSNVLCQKSTMPKMVGWICNPLSMTFDDVFKLYIGKNVLNKFRQDNGYKEGTYRKVWRGREDNEYMMDYLDKWDFETYFNSGECLQRELERHLQMQYREFLARTER